MHRDILRVIALSLLAVASQDLRAQELARAESAFVSARYGEARNVLAPLIARSSPDPAAAYLMGRTLLAVRDVDGAVEWLSRAVEGADSTIRYHVWLGRALGEQARAANVFKQPMIAASSREHLERAVSLAPKDIDARKALSEWYAVAPAMLGGGKQKAREQAAEIGRLNAYEGRLQMAWVLADGNDPRGAEQELLAAMKAYPDSVAVVHALSDLYLQRLNRAADGWQLEQELQRKQPQNVIAKFYFGRAGVIAGKELDSAESALRAYLGYSPRHAEPTLAAAHYRLGSALAQKGNRVAARAEYEEALRLDAGLTAAKTALEALK